MPPPRPHRPDTSIDLRALSIGMISSYPPTRCGIGRFASSLGSALEAVAPNVDLGLARVVDGGEVPTTRSEELAFEPTSNVAARAVGRHMNRHDVVILQHEYGLYGPDDGIAVLDVVSQVRAPLISVLHTVVAEPTTRQLDIVVRLALQGQLVVPTEAARARLVERYGIDRDQVSVIPHGAAWNPAPNPPRTRRRLVTWGLLGPGKGIERALQAVAGLEMRPAVTYEIVGQTHPKVFRRLGGSYRSHLEAQAKGLGIGHRVRFVDRYLDDTELYGVVASADVVVIPYDNDDQICSGVLTDAIAAGRPVVATGFPHAVEALAAGAGIVTGHDHNRMAAAISRLLLDDAAYARAAEAARRQASTLSWNAVAERYLEVAHLAMTAASVA